MSGSRPRSRDTTHELDLRALAPAATVDANGNIARSAFDPLGRAVAGGPEGHVRAQPRGSGALGAWTAPAGTTLAAILADPRGFLGTGASATWTDDRAWEERQAPVAVARAALVHTKGNLHDHAWEIGDEIVKRMRSLVGVHAGDAP